MKIGILGPGKVAQKMIRTLKMVDGVTCAAVGSRDLVKAKDFCAKYDIHKAYGSYEELVRDPKIDVIYVATPHSHHYEHMKLCIENNKHILCEKAFTVNAAQAKEIFELAKEQNLLVVEGLWTRFLPMVPRIRELLDSEMVGKPTSLSISMCHPNIQNERVHRPELAGGTLLNLSVYMINFTSMIFGDEVKSIHSSAVMTKSGVDAHNSITFTYKNGRVATMHGSSTSLCSREAMICCERGYIRIPNAEKMDEVLVYDMKHKVIETLTAEAFTTGFEYQILAVQAAIEEGKRECAEMPHSTSLLMMERMDLIRGQWGLKFPCE